MQHVKMDNAHIFKIMVFSLPYSSSIDPHQLTLVWFTMNDMITKLRICNISATWVDQGQA